MSRKNRIFLALIGIASLSAPLFIANAAAPATGTVAVLLNPLLPMPAQMRMLAATDARLRGQGRLPGLWVVETDAASAAALARLPALRFPVQAAGCGITRGTPRPTPTV